MLSPLLTTYWEGKLHHSGPREPVCSSEGFGYACIIMPDLTLFSCTITDWDISFSAHLPPVLTEGSGACLERCQYSYDQLRGINDRPSVRIDMSGYSCLLKEVIRCLSVSNDLQRCTSALMDDEILESAGKVAQILGFSFFTAACRFAKRKPDFNKLQRSWMLLAVCSLVFFFPRLFMLPVADCVLWVLNMME